MSAELQLYDRFQDPIAAIDRLGDWFAKSGMFGCEKLEQGKVLALACMCEHKSPIQIAKEYHLIEGRLSDKADSMLAKFRAKGGKHKLLVRTSEEASVELSLADQVFVSRVIFTELAKEPFVMRSDGKGFKKNYATPRARMQSLWARAISDGVRTLAPEIVAGIYTPEEIQDESGGGVATAGGETLDLAARQKEEGRMQKAEVSEQERPAAEQKAAPTERNPIITPPPAPTTAAPANGMLPLELARQVHEIVDPHAEAAFKWLVREKYLQPGQGIEHLPEKLALRIVKQAATFIRAIQPIQTAQPAQP